MSLIYPWKFQTEGISFFAKKLCTFFGMRLRLEKQMHSSFLNFFFDVSSTQEVLMFLNRDDNRVFTESTRPFHTERKRKYSVEYAEWTVVRGKEKHHEKV